MKSTTTFIIAIVLSLTCLLSVSCYVDSDVADENENASFYTADEGTYTAKVMDNAENKYEFNDHSYIVKIFLDGEEVGEEVYNKATYVWKTTINDPIVHKDGTSETERVITFPAATYNLSDMPLYCAVTIDGVEFESDQIEIKGFDAQVGTCVMVGGKALIGDGTMEVCGGKVTIDGLNVIIDNVKVTDTKETWSGYIGAAMVRYDGEDDKDLTVTIKGDVLLESERMKRGGDTPHFWGAGLEVDCKTGEVVSNIHIKGEDGSKLTVLGGEFGIITVQDTSQDVYTSIENLTVVSKVTNNTFCYVHSGCIVTHASMKISNCILDCTTTSRFGIMSGDSGDYSTITIEDSKIKLDCESPLHYTGFGNYNTCCIQSNGDITIKKTDIDAVYSCFGLKVCGAFYCTKANSLLSFIDCNIKVDAKDHPDSTVSTSVSVFGFNTHSVSFDNCVVDVTTECKNGAIAGINTSELQIINGSKITISVIAKDAGEGAHLVGIMVKDTLTMKDSSLKVTRNVPEVSLNPAIKIGGTANIELSKGHGLEIHTNYGVAIGCGMGQGKQAEYVPGYEPTKLIITSTDGLKGYEVNLGGILETERLYNNYELIYDVSGSTPTIAKDVNLSLSDGNSSNSTYLIVLAVVIVLIAVVAVAYYVHKKKAV